MGKFIRSAAAMTVFSGILTAFAITNENFIIGWICFAPLFIVLTGMSPGATFKIGVIFGLTLACLGFYWMIPGAERFTGSSVIFGVIVFIVSAIFFCLFFGLITFCFGKLKLNDNHKYAVIFNSLLIACIFCVAEALLMNISSGFPWFDFHSGNTLVANLYAIQPTAFFGIHIISFMVILVNYLVAAFISKKQWLRLFFPAGIVALYMLSGYFILQNFENNLKPGKAINIAILSENIAPEIKWNDTTGNLLANRLLDMNRAAVLLKPDIALWSESAIPWTYKKNDDLVNAVLKITQPANITHILGINTAANGNVVYNSAYCILPDGSIAGRYDKQVLLALIEKPVDGLIFPFMSSNGFTAKPGQYDSPISTPYGKAGIMICNESAVPATAYNAVKKGAQFICNLSNDGWFNNTYIVGLHFYNARLRAVETRKDVAVNSNNGFSGLINASGQVIMQERSDEPLVKMVTVHANGYNTLVVAHSLLFVYFCAIVLVCMAGAKFLIKDN